MNNTCIKRDESNMNSEDIITFNKIINKSMEVFAKTTNTLPKAMIGVKPHVFKFKKNAKPVMENRPHFGRANAIFLNKWIQWGKREGLIEKAKNSSYASRIHVAAKRKYSTPKSALPEGLRVTWARVKTNGTLRKTVPTHPDAWKQSQITNVISRQMD